MCTRIHAASGRRTRERLGFGEDALPKVITVLYAGRARVFVLVGIEKRYRAGRQDGLERAGGPVDGKRRCTSRAINKYVYATYLCAFSFFLLVRQSWKRFCLARILLLARVCRPGDASARIFCFLLVCVCVFFFSEGKCLVHRAGHRSCLPFDASRHWELARGTDSRTMCHC